MAPTVGVWRFMDDVSEMTMPGVFIDWHNTPVTDPVIPTPTRIQEDTTPPTEAFSPEQESLVAVNTDQLLEDLSNQNKELLQERRNALRWQDTASMAFKEAKDETESQKQEAKAAKKTGLLTAAKLRQQLAECIGQVAALKRGKTDAGLEKSRAEAKHRKEISVIERKIKELQISLVSAISHGRGSIRLFDELSGICQSMLDELVAKDRKLAAIETEKEKLQDRIDARSSVVEDISVIAHKNLEAYQKSSREKMKSEKAQQAAERKVGDLERKAVQVKAATDNAVQVLETKLANYVAQGEEANARVTKAEGDAEQLRRDLDNTEMARRNFEKKEGDWAARFAAEGSNPSERSSEGSSSEDWKQGIRHELEEKNKTTLATERKKFRHELKETNRTILATERRKIRHELDETNKTELATEREKIRDELTKEKRKVVVAAAKPNRVNFRFSLKAPLAADLESQKNKELRKVHQRAVAKRVKGKKGQVDWYSVKLVSTPVEVDRSQLEAQIRGELEDEVQNRLAAQATGLQNSHDHEKSQLGPQIRSQLQTELQTKYDTTERPRLEAEIRTRLETEIRAELTTEFQHKQTAFFDSERSGLEAKIRADIQDQNQNTATAGSPEGAMLLESMSTESNEAHELLQEIASVGIPRGSAAENVLQGLNRAKEALYNVKCELRQQEALADKNELLSAVKGVHISTHYIGKLNANTQQVLIRQAIEANRRLEYVKNTLATNDDVAKDEMLKTLLEPLEPESEDMVIPEYPTIGSVSGNSTAFGTSSFSQTFNRVREPTVSSTSNFTAVNDSANSAPLGQSAFPLTVNSFGNVATPGNSGTNQRSSVSTDLKPNNGFRDTTTLGESKTSTPGVFNPFEASHFYNQPSLISALSQNDQDSGRSGRTTETNGNGKSQFKKTFQPLPPQGEGSAPPVGMGIAASPTPTFNFNDLSSTFRTDSSSMDHQMHRDGNQPPPSASQDQSGVIGVAISPSRSRQAKTSRGQQRRSVPKGRQLAHQAFAKDTLTSMPARTQHTNPQEQVPAAQTFESFGIPRTAFTLEPNHAFDLTPNTSLVDRGNHLRAQQDPAEYQKPLKMFQIPEAASPVSVRGKKPEAMPPQAEDVTPKTPPGCEGWTSEMEEFAQSLLKDTDIEQFKYEIGSFYPETEDMPGLTRYLQKLQQDMITEPAQVQSKQKPKQPAGWTTEMTDFVEGSLGGGNDVKTTINLFKMEVVEAFNIQGLEEHVEKLKNKLVRKNNPLAHQHQVSSAPMGWHDNMTALVQKYLREGNRDVDSMVQGLEIEEPDALHLTGIHEYVTTLVLKFQTQGGR